MTNRRWLILTSFTALALAGLGVAANARVDIYGLFRAAEGRSLPGYGDDRVAKYLLSTRYVPANFDSVLIGSSVSADWDVGHMSSLRLYNESLNGGNIVEEKAILDQLLAHMRPRAVLLVVHPYVTDSHDFNTVNIGPREVYGALGSQNLLDAYKNMLKVKLGKEDLAFDGTGTLDYGESTKKLNPTLQRIMRPGAAFAIDPIALEAHRAMVADLHARGIPIAYLIPPTSEPLFLPKRDAFSGYAATILADRRPQDRLLDFSTAEFAAFSKNVALYADGVHLKQSAAVKLTAIIDERVRGWIAAGWLSGR